MVIKFQTIEWFQYMSEIPFNYQYKTYSTQHIILIDVIGTPISWSNMNQTRSFDKKNQQKNLSETNHTSHIEQYMSYKWSLKPYSKNCLKNVSYMLNIISPLISRNPLRGNATSLMRYTQVNYKIKTTVKN